MTVGHCDPLSSPENGYLLDTDFSYGEVVRFECDSGYNLVGPPALRCVQMEVNVAWNASVPLCTGECWNVAPVHVMKIKEPRKQLQLRTCCCWDWECKFVCWCIAQ